MQFRYHLPIAIAGFAALLDGVSAWLPHRPQLEAMFRFIVIVCGLLWVVMDADRRGRRVGFATGVLMLMAQPVGFLAWSLTCWRGRWYRPFACYLAVLIGLSLLGVVGYLAYGMSVGWSFGDLMEAR
jgi:hypothetical protein